MAPRGAICLLLVTLTLEGSLCSTRYFVKMKTNASELFRARGEHPKALRDHSASTLSFVRDRTKSDLREEDERTTKEIASSQAVRRNSFLDTSTFNPDVLNKFLEEYASKIKSTTEKVSKFPLRPQKPTSEPLLLEVDTQTPSPSTLSYEQETKPEESVTNSTISEEELSEGLNDTLKRNKYYGTNSYDDRNGWVTLEAIPWSKSKISKWQANPSTQRPWPELKPWDKPTIAKPWASDYSVRPIYDNNKPWYEKPKPNWQEANNDKPWQKPTTRPSYYPEKLHEVTNQAQKWPPEGPSWNKYAEPHRPNGDIITDDRPSNFPNNWNRPQSTKPSYHQFVDRYSPDKSAGEEGNDWHDFPPRYEQSNDRLRATTERPNFSQYQYVNNHPPSYPANGDGQWVLLSTNRGYSKSRQRSIKIDATNPEANGTKRAEREDQDPAVPVMTSKRQVRLTVLPSINGTNTTTSHGGLLEVERTFKSVEQSRKEYELERQTTVPTTIQNKRPIRNTLIAQPSSSAVLAAVGAGMLPATMAMMIPMMLGRRKRELTIAESNRNSFRDSVASLRDIASPYRFRKARSLRT